MNSLRRIIATVLLCTCITSTAQADDTVASKDEAMLLVKKAVAYLKDNGKAKAFAEFNNPAGGFIVGNLYIFVYDLNGVALAIGNNPRMVGKSLYDMRDVDGVYPIREAIRIARTNGSGWFNYRWPDPATNRLGNKSSYIERVDDVFVGTGIYH